MYQFDYWKGMRREYVPFKTLKQAAKYAESTRADKFSKIEL